LGRVVAVILGFVSGDGGAASHREALGRAAAHAMCVGERDQAQMIAELARRVSRWR
jgi:hypothetical protein